MAFEKVNEESKDMYGVILEKKDFSQKPHMFYHPRFSEDEEIQKLTLQELANKIAKGKGFEIVPDNDKFLLCLDFDNTLSFCGSFDGFGDERTDNGTGLSYFRYDFDSSDVETYRTVKKELCPKSPEYITMDDALAKLKEMGIEPAIAYHTYSSTPEWERFRFVIPFEREEKIQNENEYPHSNPSYEETFNILMAVRGVFGSSVDFYDGDYFFGTDKEVLFNKDYKTVNEHTAENILEYFEKNVTNEEIFKRIDNAKNVSDHIKAEAEKMDISKYVRDALICYQSLTERGCKGYEYLSCRKETFKKALDVGFRAYCGYDDFGTPDSTLKEWQKEWEEEQNMKNEKKYGVILDDEVLSNKPLREFTSANTNTKELSLHELADEIAKGKGFKTSINEFPSKHKDTENKAEYKDFLICLDFDNTLSLCGSPATLEYDRTHNGLNIEEYKAAKKELCPKSPEYITMDDALEKLKEMGIEPAIAYHTFSSTPDWERFRIIIPFEYETPNENESNQYEYTEYILDKMRGIFGSSIDYYENSYFFGTDKEVLFNKDYQPINKNKIDKINEYFEKNITDEEIIKRIDDAKNFSDYVETESKKMNISEVVRRALVDQQSVKQCRSGYDYIFGRKETCKKAIDVGFGLPCRVGVLSSTFDEWYEEWEKEQPASKYIRAEKENNGDIVKAIEGYVKENNDDTIRAIEDYVKEGNGEYHITEIDGKDLGFDIFVKNDEGICDIAVRVPVTQNSSAKIQGIRTIHSCDSLIGDDFSEKFTDALNKGRKYIERTADKSIEKG